MQFQGRKGSTVPEVTPVWLTTEEAAARARCSLKIVYRAAAAGKLTCAKVNARGDLRFRAEWIDAWLEATTTPVEVRR